VRALATYAVMRKRFHFLRRILPRFVRGFTLDNLSQVFVPLVFWPFSGGLGLPDMRGGRNRTLWNERIQGAWVPFFGTPENFLAAASQLEFILEFNSYVFEAVKHPEIGKLKQKLGNRYFGYEPDFWASRLDETVPIAELFYDALAADRGFPPEFTILEQAIDLVLKGKGTQDRLLFLGGFLAHLKAWQAEVMMHQFSRFPFMFDWPGRLKAITFAYLESKKPQ